MFHSQGWMDISMSIAGAWGSKSLSICMSTSSWRSSRLKTQELWSNCKGYWPPCCWCPPQARCFQVLLQSWREELLKPHWPNMPAVSQLAGRAADAVGILLNHWRRVTHSQTAWEKFISRLDVSQEAAMERLRKQMQGGPTTKKRALKPKVSDVSMDSLGFPKMTAMEVEKGDEDEEDEEDVATGNWW